MAFDVNTITVQGTIAVASATVGNKFVIDGCDATTDVLTQAQAAQIAVRPANPGSTTSEISLAGSTDNHVFAYAEFLQGESTGGDFNTFYLYGHLQDMPDTVVVIAVASASATTHIPEAGDVTNRTEIQFDLTFTPNADVVKVADTSMFCTRGEFLILKDRVVTTHKEGNPTVGENQTIYGDKDFKGTIRALKVYPPSVLPEYTNSSIGDSGKEFNYAYIDIVTAGVVNAQTLNPKEAYSYVGTPNNHYENGYIDTFYANTISATSSANAGDIGSSSIPYDTAYVSKLEASSKIMCSSTMIAPVFGRTSPGGPWQGIDSGTNPLLLAADEGHQAHLEIVGDASSDFVDVGVRDSDSYLAEDKQAHAHFTRYSTGTANFTIEACGTKYTDPQTNMTYTYVTGEAYSDNGDWTATLTMFAGNSNGKYGEMSIRPESQSYTLYLTAETTKVVGLNGNGCTLDVDGTVECGNLITYNAVLPDTDEGADIGSSQKKFTNGYIKNITTTGITAPSGSDISVGANLIPSSGATVSVGTSQSSFANVYADNLHGVVPHPIYQNSSVTFPVGSICLAFITRSSSTTSAVRFRTGETIARGDSSWGNLYRVCGFGFAFEDAESTPALPRTADYVALCDVEVNSTQDKSLVLVMRIA